MIPVSAPPVSTNMHQQLLPSSISQTSIYIIILLIKVYISKTNIKKNKIISGITCFYKILGERDGDSSAANGILLNYIQDDRHIVERNPVKERNYATELRISQPKLVGFL
jgi:hypothetical protein